jgi:hypothetical protein
MLRRVKDIGPPRWNSRRLGWRRWGGLDRVPARLDGLSRSRLSARNPAHAANLRLELPVSVLQLLDGAGHLTQIGLQALDAQDQIGVGRLRTILPGRLRRRARPGGPEHAVKD